MSRSGREANSGVGRLGPLLRQQLDAPTHMASGPAALLALGSTLEMSTIGPHSRSTESDPDIHQCPKVTPAHPNLRSTGTLLLSGGSQTPAPPLWPKRPFGNVSPMWYDFLFFYLLLRYY